MTFDELWGRSTPNSWARVPRGPAAVAVGAWLFGTTGVAFTVAGMAITWGTIAGFLITTAVTSWALSALTPKPPGTTNQTLGNVREAVGDFDIVYGEVRKGGSITFMETSDRIGYKRFKDDYLHFIIVLAGHEVQEIGDVYFNDEKVTIDANGFVTGERWKSLARVKKHLGSPNQLADPDLVAETSVDSNFRGRGIAYLYIRLDWDKDVFANGIPTITAMVKGRKVYDPRSGNTVWTDNAALCIRDYLEQPFGLNSIQSPSSLGSSDWATAANVSDTLITKKGGASEKRYTLNGVVSTANTPRTNLQYMLTSCGGTLFWGQGRWQFKAGYFPSGPYVSFDADDLRSGISLITKNSRKENFNAVTGTFLDKEQDYIEVDYPKVESSVFLERDNNQTNILDMSFPYTTSSPSAQRLAKMALFRSREEIVISADFGLKAAKVKVGDVIQFTFDRYGFNNKYFEVISWKPTTDNGELKINLILRETSAAAYDWNAEEKDILGNNTNLPDPTSGLTISNLSVTNRQTLQSDGSLLGEVVLAWDEADSAFIDKYVVQWKKSTDTSWSATETDESSIVIPSVKSGVSYDYRVKAVNFAGFSGPWEQLTTIVDGKQVPPGIPTSLRTKNLYKAVEVTWVNPTDRDLNHIEIWGSANSNVSNATLLGKSGGTKFIFNMEPMEEKWFFVRAVDNSNNKSAFTTGVKGTALFIEQSDVNIDVDQLLEDAGLSAVEVLPSLPTSGNFDGRTVYNTDDRQLYIYDGVTGTWKPAVEPFNPDDLTLERDNFPPDLKPVEVLSTLPTTGNFEGRVVMLLSDGKIYRYKNGSFTAAVPTVDLTGTINTGQIANGAITSAKLGPLAVNAAALANNAITETKIADGAITTPKLTANAVVADKIAANAITASKLTLMDFTNLVPDAEMQDVSAWTGVQADGLGVFSLRPNTSFNGVSSSGDIVFWSGRNVSAANQQVTTYNFPVRAGDELFISGQIIPAGGGSSVNARIDVSFYNEADVLTTTFAVGTKTSSSGSNTLSNSTVVPNGSKKMRLRYFVHSNNTSDLVLSGPTVRIKSKAELIVDGAITTDKLSANAITADKINSNAVTADKISANAITSDKIDANAITAGKISAGAVGADAISSKAILASKLAVMDFSNVVPDSSFQDVNIWKVGSIIPSNLGGVRVQSLSGWGDGVTGAIWSNYLDSTTGWTVLAQAQNNRVPVSGGKEYFYQYSMRRVNSGTGSGRMAVWFYTPDGSSNGSAGLGSITTTSSVPVVTQGSFVVPAGTSEMVVGFQYDSSYSSGVIFRSAEIREKNAGLLIVDGAIKTNLLEASAVTADKIASNSVNTNHLVANAVTAGIIAAGAVSAAAIQSGAVTADKINVNSLSAISANLGTIQVGSANIADSAISNAKIANSAITNAKIGNGAITNAKIGNLAVDRLKLAGNSVTVPYRSWVSSTSTGAQFTFNTPDPSSIICGFSGSVGIPKGKYANLWLTLDGDPIMVGNYNSQIPSDMTDVNMLTILGKYPLTMMSIPVGVAVGNHTLRLEYKDPSIPSATLSGLIEGAFFALVAFK